jgi:hypothetical protein
VTAQRELKVTVGIPTFNRAGLLRESMASVLAQSYHDFRLLVCDNASTDATSEVVASFADPRIDYVRSERNIGMIGNFNRIVEMCATEYVVLLPDDDILYPDYLECTVDALERNPSAGLVHTAFDLIDGSSRVIQHDITLLKLEEPVTIESGHAYLQRSMCSNWTVCFPSALFRTRAIAAADGHRADDEPMADVPMFMRIACDWDFACLSRTLAATRVHTEAFTAQLGSYRTGVGYDLQDSQPEILNERRQRFLDEAELPKERSELYRSLANRTFRVEKVHRIIDRAGSGTSWIDTSRALGHLVQEDMRVLLLPATWRFCAAQLGARRAKRVVTRLGAL